MSAALKIPVKFGEQPRMRLVREDEATGADRRVFPRKEVHVDAKTRRLDFSLPARQQPQVQLAIRDVSMGGLSAVSPMPLEAGERINVFFPPLGTLRGWDAFGKVIRCEPSGMGYRVAVQFDGLLAA